MERPVTEVVKVFKLDIADFELPTFSSDGLKVSYSRTEPTICEVWRDKTSLMFMVSSPNTILAQFHSRKPVSDFTNFQKHSDLFSFFKLFDEMYKNSTAHRFINQGEDVSQHNYINMMSGEDGYHLYLHQVRPGVPILIVQLFWILLLNTGWQDLSFMIR